MRCCGPKHNTSVGNGVYGVEGVIYLDKESAFISAKNEFSAFL